MKRTSSRFFLSTILLAVVGTVSGCGGDDSSSPSRAGNASDAGLDAESSVSEDADVDAPPKEAGVDAAPDALPDGVLDSDGDGVPDSEDICPGSDDHIDGDGDGVPDGCDACPTGDNSIDSDGDGFADGCDICPGFNESIDTNGSGVPDCRDALKLWLRASDDVFADDGAGAIGGPAMDGNPVRQWRDQGVWSSHGAQTDPNRQPKYVANALPSGGPAVRFEGTTEDTINDDCLEGALLMSGKGARTVFVVARTSDATNTSILELNRLGTSSGSAYRVTPEIGVRVNNGNAIFANQPLDDQFHIITFQSPSDGTTTSIRAWYDGIPIDPTEVAPRAIDTGSGGYRLGDGHILGGAGFTGDIAEVIVYEDALTDAERAAVGLTLERKHGLKSWYVPSPEPVSIYLLAGQSNMVGQGDSEGLAAPLNSTQGDVMAWMSGSVGWTPLRWGSGNLPTQFGPELGFGRTMADADPDARIGIIKYAVNGTSLAVDWNPATGPVYAGFVSALVQAGQGLAALGVDYEVRGLMWMQGESDAMDQAMADAYQTNMVAFIGEVRTLVGVPDLPVVMARIRGNMAAPFDYSLTVRMAQESVAAGDPNVSVIDTDPLTLHPDGVHYDTAGQLQLGQLFADAAQ